MDFVDRINNDEALQRAIYSAAIQSGTYTGSNDPVKEFLLLATVTVGRLVDMGHSPDEAEMIFMSALVSEEYFPAKTLH